jgi:hypothetical protein
MPNGWVLRKKNSSAELRTLRLSSDSRLFAAVVQGPGINSGNPSQYGSLLCLYYVPQSNQGINQADQGRALFTALQRKLSGLQNLVRQDTQTAMPEHFAAQVLGPLSVILTPAPTPPKAKTVEIAVPVVPKPRTPAPPRREHETPPIPPPSPQPAPRAAAARAPWHPQEPELRAIKLFPDFLTEKFRLGFFPDNCVPRFSFLYHTNTAFLRFFEAVYVHAYTDFDPPGTTLLVNLILDAREKSEDLRQICRQRFNTDALPKELQELLFQENPPFSKLRVQILMHPYREGKEKIQLLRPHYAVANMPFQHGAGNLVCGTFAMRLYGAQFMNNGNEVGTSHFPTPLPPGFCLKNVHTHSGTDKQNREIWIASPNNCQIAGTENYSISRSFFSVVMGKCMQYCDNYSNGRPWDTEATAIVTLHILSNRSENFYSSDISLLECYKNAEGKRVEPAIPDGTPLSVAAKILYNAWEIMHRGDKPKPKNPFQELCELVGVQANPDAP